MNKEDSRKKEAKEPWSALKCTNLVTPLEFLMNKGECSDLEIWRDIERASNLWHETKDWWAE